MLFRLLQAAADSPAARGVFFDGAWQRYASLAEDALRIAAVLRRHGVGHGDTVGIMLGSETRLIASYFACAALGAVAMPLNPRYAHAELSLLLGAARPSAIVTRAPSIDKCRAELLLASPAAPVLAFGDAQGVPLIDDELRELAPITPVECATHDAAVILHTSGSTGRSKLVRRTHGQVHAELDGLAAVAPATCDDLFFAAVPLVHAYGYGNCVMASIHAGASLMIAPEGVNAMLGRDALADLIASHGVTVLPGVPLTLELLAGSTRAVAFPRLRLCTSAGTGLPEATFLAFLQRYAVPIRQLYGCSEGGALTLNTAADVRSTWASVGRAFPAVRLRIVDPDDAGTGLISVSAPSMTAGYDGLPAVNAESFVDGWFHTGDRGRLDQSGNLYITGKRALYIEVAGHKIDPYEIEDVLVTHPRVREAAVVGVPGRWGTRLKAVIVPEGEAPQGAELRRHCAGLLADYKVPHEVEFCEALPRSPLGKVLKKYLV